MHDQHSKHYCPSFAANDFDSGCVGARGKHKLSLKNFCKSSVGTTKHITTV